MNQLGAIFGDACALVLAADYEARDVLEKDERDGPLVAQLDEMGALQRRLGKEDAVVGDDADKKPMETREASHQRRAVALFEFIETGAVDEPRDDFVNVVRLATVGI